MKGRGCAKATIELVRTVPSLIPPERLPQTFYSCVAIFCKGHNLYNGRGTTKTVGGITKFHHPFFFRGGGITKQGYQLWGGGTSQNYTFSKYDLQNMLLMVSYQLDNLQFVYCHLDCVCLYFSLSLTFHCVGISLILSINRPFQQ